MTTPLSSDEQAAADYMADALRQLHESTHPLRQPGEFTIAEFAAAQIPPIGIQQADNELRRMLRVGRVEKPPKRFIDSRLISVYKLVS
jgi:hypothetical protein